MPGNSGKTKSKLDPKLILKTALVSLLLTMLLLTLFYGIFNPEDSADSYVFTRLTKSLPSYSTSSDWIRVDRPDLYWENEYMPDRIFEDAYETPIWVHPPLPNILTWPIVQLTDNFRLLKVIPTGLFLISLYLLYLTLRKKLKPWQLLVCFSPVPFMTVALYGVPYFYYDTFMISFFVISIYLISRNSRWRYLTAVLMVLSKTPAIILLIPLALWNKNWKMLLPGLAIIPYLIATWVVSGNPFYIIDHWMTMSTYIQMHYEAYLANNIFNIILYSGVYIFIPILVLSIWKSWKLRGYYYAPVLGLIALILAGWAFIPY